MQWISTRRSEGSGFYTWDTAEKETDVGTWTAKSGSRARIAWPIPLTEGGYFKLRAEAKDAEGRLAVTETSFYALGPGYTAWSRYDHNRIDLVPERKTYKPGDTARIMIKSPWEKATALVTTEREGIRTHRRFALESSQQAITVPITEADIPNIYVSVLLVKGRTKDATPDDGSDPGKPSFRLGYVQLEVEDASKRLAVTAKADKDEFRPANKATCHGHGEGRMPAQPSPSEVTLWAVDYGVLSLTAFQTPDVLKSVYVREGAAGPHDRQPAAHRQPPRPDAEGRRRRRRRRRGTGRRHDAEGLPRAGVLGRLGRHRCQRSGHRGRDAARVAHDVPDHGGRSGQGVALRLGRKRDPRQQAADDEADVPALPGARRQGILRRRRDEPAQDEGRRRRSPSRASTRRFSS